MPDSRGNSKRAAVVASGEEEDRISTLPDGVLQHVLSSLPSDEVVRTCVLARRWRHLWKSTPAVRITRDGGRDWRAWTLNNFVNHLLLLRGGSPADECEISCGEFHTDDEDELFRFVNLWIRHVFSFCQVRVLKICIRTWNRRLRLANTPFVSQLLTKVELQDAILKFRTLDFSSCPALDHLDMSSCIIYGNRILSQSVRYLSITGSDFKGKIRTRISAPSLTSLQLDGISGRTPLLERMHLLVAAQVKLDYCCQDMCRHNVYGDCDNDNCHGQFNNSDARNSCVLLESLSGATNLELTSDYDVFIFRKDCKFCPTFSKLKILLLNEWCVAAHFDALIFFLQNSPVLEKLTLQLEHYETKQHVVETGDSYNPTEHSLVSKQLKVVEIKCSKENELIEQISNILRIHGVPPEQIEILPSETSSFYVDSDSEW
ncbi:unnamed protein product [Urochloa humidicola]